MQSESSFHSFLTGHFSAFGCPPLAWVTSQCSLCLLIESLVSSISGNPFVFGILSGLNVAHCLKLQPLWALPLPSDHVQPCNLSPRVFCALPSHRFLQVLLQQCHRPSSAALQSGTPCFVPALGGGQRKVGPMPSRWSRPWGLQPQKPAQPFNQSLVGPPMQPEATKHPRFAPHPCSTAPGEQAWAAGMQPGRRPRCG